jgi:hypothetical protein
MPPTPPRKGFVSAEARQAGKAATRVVSQCPGGAKTRSRHGLSSAPNHLQDNRMRVKIQSGQVYGQPPTPKRPVSAGVRLDLGGLGLNLGCSKDDMHAGFRREDSRYEPVFLTPRYDAHDPCEGHHLVMGQINHGKDPAGRRCITQDS